MLRGRAGKKRVTRENDELYPTRRNFIRRAGIAGGIMAAVIGTADLAGMSSAVASSKKQSTAAEPCCFTCTFDPGHCNGGAACPSGSCCFHCVGSCGSEYTQCLTRPNCDKFGYCL